MATPNRAIRIPDDDWEKFKKLAKKQGSTASGSIAAYVARCVELGYIPHAPKVEERPVSQEQQAIAEMRDAIGALQEQVRRLEKSGPVAIAM